MRDRCFDQTVSFFNSNFFYNKPKNITLNDVALDHIATTNHFYR